MAVTKQTAQSSNQSNLFFFFNETAPTEIYTLSLHDALPISVCVWRVAAAARTSLTRHITNKRRSEEHTSELQSRRELVCRLLLEKNKTQQRRPAGRHRTDCHGHSPEAGCRR